MTVESSSEQSLSTVETIRLMNGAYCIAPILVGNDYVAIAPITVKRESSIIIPDEELTVGILIGIGPLVPEDMRVAFKIGTIVRFSSTRPIEQLDRLYPFYGKARILLMRRSDILVEVPGDPVRIMGVDKTQQ